MEPKNMSQKFAAYDAHNRITAFYDSVDSPAPEGIPTIALTDAHYTALLDGQSLGKRMAIDERGQPVLLDPPQAARETRTLRDAAMKATDWLVLRHQDETLIGHGTTLSTEQFAALLTYRQALRDISDAPQWPAVDLPSAPDFVT
jgi:hypothetical protein